MKKIQLMDTTLRDGEQNRGVSFSSDEKLSLAKLLLNELKVDRIEVASANVSEGEKETVRKICSWAEKNDFLEKIEVLGFVNEKSISWLEDAGCRTMNLLTKGSEKHCINQLKKNPEEHFHDAAEIIETAISRGISVNVYLEDWSNGIQQGNYVEDFLAVLKETKINRLLLPDTLGILNPQHSFDFVKKTADFFPLERTDFHAHNDYGFATANSFMALKAGATGLHGTINGLGERTGNASTAELIVMINDHLNFNSNADETAIIKASKFVEKISTKKISANKPIVGKDVFTQTAGIHADGDAKGNLYVNALNPERFGSKREYALGKLSGKASLEQNLKELDIELTQEQKTTVLTEIISLGDKKEIITAEDLPYIIADVLKTPIGKKIKIIECTVSSSIENGPYAQTTVDFNGTKIRKICKGDGGYDAFMNCLNSMAEELEITLPLLVDYEVSIPPGGKTDALVQTIITWKLAKEEFQTTGVDSDQVIAAVKATEKMLNKINIQNP